MSEIFIIKDTGKGVINGLLPEKVVPIKVKEGVGTTGDSYSTEEIRTGGTWIDGKPIYRKVYHITDFESVAQSDFTAFCVPASFFTEIADAEIFIKQQVYLHDDVQYYDNNVINQIYGLVDIINGQFIPLTPSGMSESFYAYFYPTEGLSISKSSFEGLPEDPRPDSYGYYNIVSGTVDLILEYTKTTD